VIEHTYKCVFVGLPVNIKHSSIHGYGTHKLYDFVWNKQCIFDSVKFGIFCLICLSTVNLYLHI